MNGKLSLHLSDFQLSFIQKSTDSRSSLHSYLPYCKGQWDIFERCMCKRLRDISRFRKQTLHFDCFFSFADRSFKGSEGHAFTENKHMENPMGFFPNFSALGILNINSFHGFFLELLFSMSTTSCEVCL